MHPKGSHYLNPPLNAKCGVIVACKEHVLVNAHPISVDLSVKVWQWKQQFSFLTDYNSMSYPPGGRSKNVPKTIREM